MQVREIQADDISKIVAIEKSATMFPWSEKNFRDSLKSGHYAWAFSDESDEILGYTFVQKVLDELHLLNICVKPSFQGRGFGRKILHYVIDFANSISASLILLEVRRSNVRAQNMYTQAGFNEMSVRKDYYPAETGREDAILMAMDLGMMSLFSTK